MIKRKLRKNKLHKLLVRVRCRSEKFLFCQIKIRSKKKKSKQRYKHEPSAIKQTEGRQEPEDVEKG